jgi:hypothetical protein
MDEQKIETSKINLNMIFPASWTFIRWNDIPQGDERNKYMIQLYYRTNTRAGCRIFIDYTFDEFTTLLDSKKELYFIAIDKIYGVIGIISCEPINEDTDTHLYINTIKDDNIYFIIYTKWSCALTSSYVKDNNIIIKLKASKENRELHNYIDMQDKQYSDLIDYYGLYKNKIKSGVCTDVLSIGKFLKINLFRWMNTNITDPRITNFMTLGWSINERNQLNNDGVMNTYEQLGNLINNKTGKSAQEIDPSAWITTDYVFWNIPKVQLEPSLSEMLLSSLGKAQTNNEPYLQKYLKYKQKYINLKKIIRAL